MCDLQFERRIAFAFLDAIRQRFATAYGDQAKTALAYAMKDFSAELSKQMVGV